MCARYTLRASAGTLMELYYLTRFPEIHARYNIAPTQNVVAIRDEGAFEARWGLIPSWTKDPAKLPLMINARIETATEKPSFRGLVKSKRCLILADGYIEWRAEEGIKQPYLFEIDGGEPFAFAGLWDHWPDQDVTSVTLLTTQPNAFAAEVHDRMPVLLDQELSTNWLNPDYPLQAFEEPFPAARLTRTAIQRAISNPRIDNETLIQPV